MSVLSFSDENFNNPIFDKLTINNENRLTNTVVYSIVEGRNNALWIGTTRGLYKYHLNSKQLTLINTDNGLLSNVVYSIIEDNNHYIWAATSKGLSQINDQTNAIINYTTGDGLTNQEFNLHASYKDSNGTLYFGGIEGVDFFNPKDLTLPKESNLYVSNIQFTNAEKQLIETISVSENKTLEVKHNQFPFYVNFSNINLNYFKNTQFAYRLKPDDKNWNYIQNTRKIQFLKLSPGNYILEIQGVFKGKVWTKNKPLTIQITVTPVWWKSNWAILSYLLLLFGLAYFFYKYSIRRKLEHQERLKLIELNKLKTKLYNNITHELRTPLTVIMGTSDSISAKMDQDELTRFKPHFDVLNTNSKNLLLLINQMLDLSSVEQGKMEINYHQADIIPYIQMIIDSFKPLASQKNIELISYFEENKLIMDFDSEKITAIISNIIANSLKFTPENGKVIVHLQKKDDKNQSYLILRVKDNGIGISEKHIKHIFDRFYQIDQSASNGTGIGLSLTKELVSLLQGTITVKSKLTKGTEFKIKLPINCQADIKSNIPFTPQQNNLRQKTSEHNLVRKNTDLPLLLLIEDHNDIAQFIVSIFKDKYNILLTSDGESGIKKAFESIPDVIITDVMMPIKDGYEVCETLKNDQRTSHIPIIILTAKTLEKDKIKGLAYGADAYIKKPFNKNELLIRVEQLIALRKNLQKHYNKNGFTIKSTFSKETDFIETCVEHINKNISNEHFKSLQLAQAVSLSESQLYRKIKHITNLSTAIFIRNVRLEIAKNLLLKSDDTISEIAYSCGFSNPDWFTKSFKEKYGDTPSSFRIDN